MRDGTARTFCQICRAECGMIAHLEDGKVVRIEGDPEDPWSRGKLCVKGRNAHRILYAKDRILHPLLRDVRGRPFRRVSWDEAVNFIAGKLQALRGDCGPETLVFYRGTTAKVVDDAVLSRLAKLYGTPNVTGTWSVCVGPKILAYNNTFGRPPMPWCDLRNARYIILWGASPTATHLHRYHGISTDIRAARQQGARLVVIDPRRLPIAAQADAYLQIRPGTDLALALAMIHHIVGNSLHDQEFVEAHTLGFHELAEHVAPYTPQWAERITEVPGSTIEEVATGFAVTKPASLDRRQGVQHCRNATQTLRAMAILMAITGNVDVEGGLMLTPYRSLKSLPVPDGLPSPAPGFWQDRFPMARDVSALLPEAILSKSPYPIRGLVVIEGNPMSCFANTGKVRQALASLDLVVIHDLFMNDSTEFADVVLPACTFLEKGEISVQSLRTDYPVRTRLPVVEPRGEAYPEWKWLSLLGRRLGYEEFFPFDTDQQAIDAVLSQAGWTDQEPATPTIHGRVLETGFTTPSGRIELYSRSLEERGADPLPTAPIDWPEDDAYPYYLITGAKVPQFYHSQHRNVPALRKAHPEPLVEMSRALAAEVGLRDGQQAIIETHVGTAVFKAKISEAIHPLTVSIPHGWAGPHNANWLVDDVACDPLAGTPPFRDMRCRVKKFEGR
ncbi:MAG TPA: molybdopterin-dependent oxidoreductase [Anaerolineae bacterium]|nr:molybdopterin-dependent oxidoreductase [Anaerolineae bacterium]